MKEWFESWFDTHYYHVLYKNRDHSEAEVFIKNLFTELAIQQGVKVLDLACGKGRHSIFVNSLGFDTTGVDLSTKSIAEAQIHQNETLRFFEHDMRKPLPNLQFGLVLNLFTSFGYFDCNEDNLAVFNSIHSYLDTNGLLVVDFMNSAKEVKNLIPSAVKEEEGISFKISKKYENGFILKEINFQDCTKEYAFNEKVQALTLENFLDFFEKTNFVVKSVYGNYHLEPYSEDAERLILIAQKK
jgi:SAM-dependent methyltransferase